MDINLALVVNQEILFSENLVSHMVNESGNKFVNQFVKSSSIFILYVRVSASDDIQTT